MGAQGDALDYAPNMDGFSTGGYICWGFTKQDYEKYLSTDKDLFRWAAASSLWDIINPQGRLAQIYNRTQELGVEMVMYEGGFHTNFGNGPSEPRNRLVTSVGGETIYLNHMLLKLRDMGMRRQSYFVLTGEGHKFSGTGAFGSEEAGYVRIFGKILRLPNEGDGEPRFRPGWLALSLVNNVILENMVQTNLSEGAPTFTVTAIFPDLRETRRNQAHEETLENLPEFFSYAFREGKKRSVILVNLNTEESRSVILRFNGYPQPGSATGWFLKADHYTDNNEIDWNPESPQVTLETRAIDNFANGYNVNVPPLRLVAIEWENDE